MKLLHQGNQKLILSYRQNFDFPMHLQNALELVWVTAGQTTVIYAGERRTLFPGDIFIAFPNQTHGYENSIAAQGYLLIVPMTPYLESFRSTLESQLPKSPVLKKEQWAHTAVGQFLEMAAKDAPNASQKVMQGYVMLILGKLLPLLSLQDSQSASSNATQALLLYINHHYTEPLTRQDIARAIGYHESYISHIFSDVLHTTLTDYITTLRLDDARRLLTDTRLTVSQIALSLGFGSIRTFNRVFLRQTGATPTAYRTNNP